MKTKVLAVLLSMMSAKAVGVESQPHEPARDVAACAPKLAPAKDDDWVDRAHFDEGQLETEVQSLLDAFSKGQVHSIDIVTSYGKDMNGLQRVTKNNALLRGSMSGKGVDDALANLEDQMGELAKMMNLYSPEALEAKNKSILARMASFVGRAENQAKALTTSFTSNESKIASIIKGLGDARAQITVDNEMLEEEINRLNEKIVNLATQRELWMAREAKLREFKAQLQGKLQNAQPNSSAQHTLKQQLEILETQILLPISLTVTMIENQIDIFEASVVAQRGQQDQNKLVIQTGHNLEKTAEEVLPTIVMMAVTTARTSRVIDLQQGGKQLMEQGLQGITRQMDINAQRSRQMLEDGTVSQEQIFKFREEVLRIVDFVQTGKSEILQKVDASRVRRAALIEKQAPLMNSLKQRTQFGVLSSPEDVPQIGNAQ